MSIAAMTLQSSLPQYKVLKRISLPSASDLDLCMVLKFKLHDWNLWLIDIWWLMLCYWWNLKEKNIRVNKYGRTHPFFSLSMDRKKTILKGRLGDQSTCIPIWFFLQALAFLYALTTECPQWLYSKPVDTRTTTDYQYTKRLLFGILEFMHRVRALNMFIFLSSLFFFYNFYLFIVGFFDC